MNRDIEFRAWDIETKIMVYDNEDDSYGYWDGYQDSNIGIINHLLNRKEYIFMQYTGLKDKNGKKIFEGDIVEFDSGMGGKETCLVYFDEHQLSFNIKHYQRGFIYDGLYNLRYKQNPEVISNIYEDNLESQV